MSTPDITVVESTWIGIQRVANTPKPPSHFNGRKGFDPAFLGGGQPVPLPTFGPQVPERDIARLADGSFELKYTHFSTAQCISRRVPFFSACNVDGAAAVSLPRHDTWSFDGRIPKEAQMLAEAYGPQTAGKFSRGHMTRRQDPNWGSPEEARQANQDTFLATNACPQWQPFNEGLWGDLEDYLLDHATAQDRRISVITGPVLTAQDPVRFGVQVPRDFWKVVAFISATTGKLAAIAYVMSQGRFLDQGLVGDLGDFAFSQRPLAAVMASTGLRFPGLEDKDVLASADPSVAVPIRALTDTRLPA